MPQSSTVFKVAGLACLLALISGCAIIQINDAIEQHQEASSKVSLGDSKQKVLAILEPTQSDLKSKYKKVPERYRLDDGRIMEIYYFRSHHHPDGIMTDDEFTPYVFLDRQLIAVGWAALGGPSSQARPDGQAQDNWARQRRFNREQADMAEQMRMRQFRMESQQDWDSMLRNNQ